MKTNVEKSTLRLLLVASILSGCRSVQWVGGLSTLYELKRTTSSTGAIVDSIAAVVPDGCQRAIVTVKEDMVTVKLKDPSDVSKGTPWVEPADFGLFPNSQPKLFNHGGFTLDKDRPTFRYNQGQWFLQPITVALKFRGEAIRDTIPAQVEAGFNVGFAYGYKITKTWWHPHRNLFDQQTERVALAIAPLLSMGSVELSDKNTRDPKQQFVRRVPLLSYGLMVALSFNSVTVGGVRGWDKTFTKGTDGWVYEGKPWWGLVLGIDLIK